MPAKNPSTTSLPFLSTIQPRGTTVQSEPMQPIGGIPSLVREPDLSLSGPTAEPNTGVGGKNWFALLAPVISAGLGYAIGGKAGAATGFSGGAQGAANFVSETQRAAEIRRKAAETSRELGIKETEATTRSAAVENEAAARANTLRQRKMEKAVSTGMFKDLDPEDIPEAKKLYHAKREADLAEDIGKVMAEGELPSYKTRIDSLLTADELSAEGAQSLKSQVDGRIVALKQKATDRAEDRSLKMANIASLDADRDAKLALATQARVEAEQKNKENTLNNIVRQVHSGLSISAIQKVNPEFTADEYYALKGESEHKNVRDMVYRNLLGMGRPAEQAIAEADKQADAARQKYLYDAAKVEKAVNDRKGKTSANDVEDLKEAVRKNYYTQAEANEIAKRLGLTWVAPSPTGSDTTTVPITNQDKTELGF